MDNIDTTEKENYSEVHGSGFISTMIFMVIAVITMIVVKYILNY